MIPLMIDLSGWKAVVFGGGPVGARKANFLAEEAEVTVVSKSFDPALGPKVEKVTGDIADLMEEWVGRSDLVVAATDDPLLNGRICLLAEQLGRPCNRADGISTFMIPSVVRRRNYVVALSTLGRSPAMSKYLRQKLDGELNPELELMIDLQEDLRGVLKGIIADQGERERRLRAVLDDEEIWSMLSEDPRKAARSALQKVVSDDGHDT